MRNLKKNNFIFFLFLPLFSCAVTQTNQPKVKLSPILTALIKPSVQPSTAKEKLAEKPSNTVSTIAMGLDTPSDSETTTQGKITINGKVTELFLVGTVKVQIPVADTRIELAKKETFSDKDGEYSLAEIPFGIHTLIVEKEGYDRIYDPNYSVNGNIGRLNILLLRLRK